MTGAPLLQPEPRAEKIESLPKASIPIVVLPLLTFAITVVTQAIMVLLSTGALLGTDRSVGALWAELSLFRSWTMLLYHLLAIHALWYAGC